MDFDAKYKQTDNMKKRAVKVATNYDEFKAMVACAHLKKLTKKEVESLSNVKKGWKKKSENTDPSNHSLLELEQEYDSTLQNEAKFVAKASAKKGVIANFMELDRDLRRIRDDTAKMR